MSVDLKPRLLVHTLLGEAVIDPWAGARIDLTPYGFSGYDVAFDQATEHFVVVLHHRLGDVTLDPFSGGPAPDLSAYGITGYEVVFGVPALTNPLSGNLTAWLGIGGLLAGAWLLGRRRA